MFSCRGTRQRGKETFGSSSAPSTRNKKGRSSFSKMLWFFPAGRRRPRESKNSVVCQPAQGTLDLACQCEHHCSFLSVTAMLSMWHLNEPSVEGSPDPQWAACAVTLTWFSYCLFKCLCVWEKYLELFPSLLQPYLYILERQLKK